MRFLLVALILTVINSDCLSQWKQFYPITSELYDVAVPAPGRIFLLTEEGYRSVVYQSTDSAKTWRKFKPVADEQTHSLVFTDSLTGFTASYKGVYKTTDGAKNWTLKSIDGLQDALWMVFPTKTTGYVVYSNNKIVKTTDAGVTWNLLTNTPQGTNNYLRPCSFSDADHGYVVIDFVVYKTSNGGSSWTPIQLYKNVSTICAISDDVAIAGDGYETFITTNGGATWDPLWYSSTDAIHSIDGSTILFLSPYGRVAQSVDGGKSIEHIYQSKFTIPWRKIDSSGEFVCAIGSDYSIVTSRDGGATWKVNNMRPQHGEFNAVHFSSANDGMITSADAGMILTHDNGKSWYYSEQPGRDDFQGMAFADADTGIFVVTNNYAYTTYDGGKTMFFNDWTSPIQGHLSTRGYEMINSKIIYAAGLDGSIAKSVDGGKNWIPYLLGIQNHLNGIDCTDANTCHVAGIAGMVISTWDAGEHWKIHNLDLNNDMRCVRMLNSVVGFIGGAAGMILKTSDGGNTWSKTDTEANWAVVSFEFISNTKGYAITEGGEILRTNDGGLHWTLKNSLYPPTQWSSIKTTFMRDTSHIYGISTYAIFQWTREEEEPENVTAIEESVKAHQIVIYPNPSEGLLNIVHNDPIEEVIITDARGSLVKQVTGDIQSIDIGNIREGIYIIRIRQRTQIQIKQVIKR